LLVTDNQVVKAGELLLEIDPRDYQAALDQAQADVRSADADIRNLDAQIVQQQAVIDQARADISAAQSDLTFSQQESTRYQELARTGVDTVQRAQQAAADLPDKAAALQHNHAILDAAEKQIAVLQSQRVKSQATLQHNKAVLEQAELNLGYTKIGSLITVLEECERKDWFGDPMIDRLSLAAAIFIPAFILIELWHRHPFINLRLFARAAFASVSVMAFVLGLGPYGTVYLLPVYLAQIQGYDALQIGEVVMWLGCRSYSSFPSCR
jgi:hypothetical protein